MRPDCQHARRQNGVALVTALFLVLAVLMVGLSAARTALNARRSGRTELDRHLALQAAQAALADAESDIAGGAIPASTRAAVLASGSAAAFVTGCGAGSDDLGLCAVAVPPAAPVWQSIDLAGDTAVPYGQFTGAVLATGSALLPARLPRYVIELVPFAAPGALYRITAIGFGTRLSSRVVLQSYYRVAPAGVPSPLPDKRIGWREISNWPELHEAATTTP